MTTIEKELEIHHKAQLTEYFTQGSKPSDKWGIGTEHEKFLYDKTSFKRLGYEGESGISAILNHMQHDGWQPIYEKGKIIALKKNGASITLEPGGQFELSGDNFKTVHETFNETRKHFEELSIICREHNFFSLPMGADPLTLRKDVPWMPKERYGIMKNYMPTRGELGHEMMTNTACIQVNLDYADEADMVKKMRVAQALQPIATAIFANSPFSGGKPNGFLSYRAHIWDHTDPDRTGFLSFIFEDGFGFERWVDYLLDVPMYFIYRNGEYFPSKGITFGEFIGGKHQSFMPTMEDWETHVSTVFPDVRLKRYIEMRGTDASCVNHIAALSALWVGLIYDSQSLEEASQLIAGWDIKTMQEVRAQVTTKGLNASSGNMHVGNISKQMYQIALGGLTRRSVNLGIENESKFLDPLREIIESGITQAEKHLRRYNEDCNKDLLKLVNAWQEDQMQIYPYKHEV